MSEVRTSFGKRIAYITAIALVLTLVPMLALPAMVSAGHNTQHDLECQPETDQNNIEPGNTHTVQCWVLDQTGAAQVVRFEISGPGDPDAGESFNTPDGTDNTCTASEYTGSGTATD